jgi:hypothetical protein
VLGNAGPEFAQIHARLHPGQKIIDLVRVDAAVKADAQYEGLCW